MERFLERNVKKDRKGLYTHYGSFRLRPTTKKTNFKEGSLVSMVETEQYIKSCITMVVFENTKTYEVWRSQFRYNN